MKKILLLFLLIPLQFFAQETFTISGTVKNSSGVTVPYANVYLDKDNKYSITDDNGDYRISEVKQGIYIIKISFIGYKIITKEITVDEDIILNVTLVENSETLESVIINAKTKAERQTEKVITIKSLDLKKLQNQAIGVEVVLKQSTGVAVRQSGGLGSDVTINLNGLTGGAVRTYYDGIPVELFGGAFQINDIPVDALSRVDVYKGVMPIDVGTDALGGGINLVPFNRSENYFRTSYSFGSFNTHRITLNTNYNINNHIAFSFEGFTNSTDNDYTMRNISSWLQDGSTTEVIDRVRRFHDAFRSSFGKIGLKFDNIKVADELQLFFVASQRDKEINNGTFLAETAVGETERENKAIIGQVKYRKKLFNNLLDFKYQGLFSKLTNKINDSTLAIYNWRGQILQPTETANNTNESGSEISGFPTLREGDNKGSVHRVGLRINLSDNFNINFSNFNSKLTIEGEDPIGPRIELNGVPTDLNSIPSTLKNNVFGAEATLKFFDRKLTLFGLFKNYDYSAQSVDFRPRFGGGETLTEIPWRTVNTNSNGYGGGIKYQVNPKLFVRSSYERTIRFPTEGEIFGDFAAIIPNFELRPERSNNINLGFRYTHQINDSKALMIDFGAFLRDQEDLIRVTPFGLENSQFVNQAFVENKGLELSMRYNPLNNLTLNANFTYQKLEIASNEDNVSSVDFTGSPVPNIPTTFGNFSARYKFNKIFNSNNNLDVSWNYFFVDVFAIEDVESLDRADSNNAVPRQNLNNLNLSYIIPASKLVFSLGVQNIFNQEVFDNFSVPRPGTNYNFKINYSL